MFVVHDSCFNISTVLAVKRFLEVLFNSKDSANTKLEANKMQSFIITFICTKFQYPSFLKISYTVLNQVKAWYYKYLAHLV